MPHLLGDSSESGTLSSGVPWIAFEEVIKTFLYLSRHIIMDSDYYTISRSNSRKHCHIKFASCDTVKPIGGAPNLAVFVVVLCNNESYGNKPCIAQYLCSYK